MAAPQQAEANAIVPYSLYNPFHVGIKDRTREFEIRGRNLLIHQGWKNDGRGGTKLGFGASVYDAAIVLALYLDSNADIVKHKTVIELGCGPGLVAIGAAVCGASFVLATDGDPISVQLTAQNIAQNKLDASQCKCSTFIWGSSVSALCELSPTKRYDVILGADIVACPYSTALLDLLESLNELCHDDTIILLAYKMRHHSEQAFFDKAHEIFQVEEIAMSNLHRDFRRADIQMYQAKRKVRTRNGA